MSRATPIGHAAANSALDGLRVELERNQPNGDPDRDQFRRELLAAITVRTSWTADDIAVWHRLVMEGLMPEAAMKVAQGIWWHDSPPSPTSGDEQQ